jgi:WD40 repeat protein
MFATRFKALALLGFLTLVSAGIMLAAPAYQDADRKAPVAPPRKEDASKPAEVWKEGEMIETKSYGISAILFAPDGNAILADGGGRGVKRYSLAREEPQLVMERPSVTYPRARLHLSADGKALLLADRKGAFVWDLERGVERSSMTWPMPEKVKKQLVGGSAASGAISPEGSRAVAGWSDGRLRVWDLATGMEVLTINAHKGEVRGVAFSPDGKSLASIPYQGDGKLWDATSGKELRTLPSAEIDYGMEPLFTPDGKTLIACGPRGVKQWDVATGKQKRVLNGRSIHAVNIAFSPDSKTIAMAEPRGDTIRLVDLETGKDRAVLKWAGAIQIRGVAFSPDGRLVAACDREGDIQLWEAPVEKKKL